jgi:hypothetical protein
VITFTDNMLYLNQGVEAAITNITGNGTYVVFTANNNYSAGWDVFVSNVNPSSYNGNYTNIFAANSTTFTVANTNTDSYVGGGTARGKTDQNPDLGIAAGYNDGTYHHTGIFRDATDSRWKVYDNYAPEPDASPYIDTTNSTFHLADFQANTLYLGNTTTNWLVANTSGVYHTGTVNASSFTGNLTGNVAATTISGNLTGNVAATTITGNLTGNVAAISITGNLTGNVVATTISGNLTGNVAATTVSASNVTATSITGNLTGNVAATVITGNLTGNVVATTISGNLTGNVVATTISGNLTGNVTATTISGNLTGNVAATTISGNLTGNVVATNVNAATIQVSTSVTLDNDKNLQWKAKNTSTVVGMRQQSDDNFVFYSTDATYAARPVFAIYANSSTSNLQMLVPLNLQSSLGANGSFGTAGQVLTTNGSGVYWETATAAATVNTAAQYAWTNTQSFAANLTITANAVGLTTNTSAIYFNGVADANWKVGRNTGGTSKWFYTGNTIDIIAANTATEGIVLGFTGNSYLETGYNGTYVKDRLYVGNSTSSVSANATAFVGNIVATTVSGNLTGNVAATIVSASNVTATSITGNLTGNVVATTISGNLTGNVIATTLSGNLTGNVAATTITGNLTGNVAAVTISGNLTGNVAATTITGNLTGNVLATTVNATFINATSSIVVGDNVAINTAAIQIGNSTVKTTINTTAFVGNVVATTVTGNLTGNVVATTISGNLTGNVVATTLSGNLTAITANVTNKLQIGTPGSFDFGSNAVIEIDANGNTYVQSVIQNANTGNNASADLVVTNDTGNDSVDYVDLGINGSQYNQAGYSIAGAGDAYLYSSNGHLAIGTRSAKEVIFHANGTTASNRRFTINATAVTIANDAALVANGSTGTAGHVLHSNSTGVYWAADDQGVTSVASGNGITGGTIVNTGTLYVTQGTGVVVNTSGVHVNAAYINTISANSATYLGAAGNFGNASGIYTSGLVNATTVNATTLQTGAGFSANGTQVTAADLLVTGNLIVNGTTVTLNTATLDVKDLNITLAKGTASAAAANGAGITVDGAAATLTYINASNTWLSNINFTVGNTGSNVSVNSTAFVGNVVATAVSGNLTGNVTATTISGNLTGNVAAVTITGNLTGNVVATTVNATTINATANIVVGANVLVNTSVLLIGNSTANVFVNSTAFVGNLSGTAANATLLNNKTEGNLNVNNATNLGGVAAASYVQNTDSRTLSGNINFTGTNNYFTGATLGGTAGNIGNNITLLNSLTLNNGSLRFFTERNATGTDWTSASSKIQWRIDVSDMGYIQFNPPNAAGNSSARGLAFGGDSTTEAMRVTATGNVGIGNTSPAHKLRVTGTSSLAGAVSDITTLAAGNTTITGFSNVSGNGHFSGNVGIGNAPDSTVGLFVVKAHSATATTWGIVSSTSDANAALTAAQTKYGAGSLLYNNSQNKSGDGLTSYNSNYLGYNSVVYNGLGGVDARANLMEGVRGVVQQHSNGASSNSISVARGVYGVVQNYGSGVISSAYGIVGDIQGVNNSITGNITTAFAAYTQIVSNTAMTIGTGYLYYGAHLGATTTTKYGMYLTGEQYNYFSGNVGIGNTTPAFKLRVDGTTSLAGAVSDITTLAAGNTTITGFMNVSSNLMVGSAPTTLPSALATIVSGTTVGQNYQISLSPADGALGRESGIRFGATFSQGWGGVDFVSRYSGAISYGAAGGGATPRLHAMKFYTGDGSDVPTERVRIDASGNVGIGNTAPAFKLRVDGTTSLAGAVSDITTLAAGNTTITGFVNATSTLAAGNTTITGSLVATRSITITNGGGTYQAGSIYADANWGMLYRSAQTTPVSAQFAWKSSDDATEYMRISPTGNVGIGNTSPAHKLRVTGTSSLAGAVSDITTLAAGNTTITGFANVTSTIQGGSSLAIAGALSGVTTAAMGNTTITGFANVSSNINAASFNVGATQFANTTGVYATFMNSKTEGNLNVNNAVNWGTYGSVPAAGTSFGNASTIGRSDSNGYTYFFYINSNTSNSENPGISQVIVTNGTDNFYRKASISHLTSAVQTNASGTWNITANNASNLGGTAAASYALLASPAFTGTVTAANVEADYFVTGTVTPQTIVSGVPTYQAHDTTNFVAGKTFASVAWGTATGDGSAGQFLLAKSKSGTIGSYTAVASGDALGRISWAGANATAFNIASEIQSTVDGTPTGAFVPSALSFKTSNSTVATSTRMFIAANGNVGIGTSTPSTTLNVVGSSQITSLGIGTAASGTTGEIRATNNITAYFSDKRLKKDIRVIEDALEKINKISGVTFQSNEEAEKYGYTDKRVQVGVIAQEIEAVLPQVVVPAPFDIDVDEDGNEYSKSGENYKTVQYEKIVPLLIEAIKELKAEIDALKTNKEI